MEDNQEEVVYRYTGDVSSLRQATESALGLLNKYQTQIDRISADGGFGKSTKAAKSFQSQINATTKQVTNMQKQMKGIADVRLFPSTQVTQHLKGSLISINQVFDRLASSSKLSTKEVQALIAQLRSANVGLKSNSAEVAALVQKEQKWQQTLDGVRNKTTQFRDSLDTLRGRISNVFEPMVSKLNILSTPFTKITAKLQSFRDKASETFGRVSQLASTVVSAFRRVSTAENGSADAASKSTNAHSRLRSILASIQTAFKKETTSVGKEQDALKKKNDTLQDSTRRHSSLRNILINLGRTFSSELNSVRLFNTNVKSLTGNSRLLKSALAGLISIPISQWLAEAAKQSISYAENVNLFTVAMGDSLDVGTEFIERMAEIYGMNPSSLMRYAGNFYQLADAIDMPDESAANLSLSLLKATNDISSLFNVPIEQVFNDLSSGMQGMSRAVRKYGMDIRTTTLQQTALSLGITENVDTMSEANRQGLRFITMLRQASNASGDFARTIESPANQLKVFKEQLAVLGRAIGNLFIGPLTTAITYINGFIMALSTAISYIAAFFGIFNSLFSSGAGSAMDTADGVTESVNNIGSAAGGAAKELKKMLAPFDELNILQDQTSGGGGSGSGGGALSDIGTLDPAIAAEIEKMELQLENVRMKAVEVRDALLKFFGFQVKDGVILSWDSSEFEANLINKFPQWTSTIQAAFDNWLQIALGFQAVFSSVGTVVRKVWDKTVGRITDDSVANFIEEVGGNLQTLAGWIQQHADLIANLVIALGALKVLAPVVSWVSTLLQGLPNLNTLLSTITTALNGVSGATLGWVAALAAVVAMLVDQWENNEDFRDGVIEVWEDIIDAVGPVVEQLGQVISSLWNDVLQPLLEWLITALGPSIADIVLATLEVVSWVIGSIAGLISSLLQVLQGIINFVTGVFTFDWRRAWDGIVDIFAGIFNAVSGVVIAVMNAVISVINAAITVVYNAVIGIINAIAEVVNSIAGALGFSINLGITAQAPRIPYIEPTELGLATGGVVTSPTRALIGEGRYDEAVIPLGNSPQMRQFADSVASRVSSGEQTRLLKEQNELLKQILDKSGTYLDGRLITDTVSKYQRIDARALGV